MKRQVLNLTLLTALLTPMAMGTEIISDEELEDVIGQGGHLITNAGNVNAHQDNNNKSVILHHNTQRNVSGAYIVNSAASADNNGTNIASLSVNGPTSANVNQTNDQCAKND